MLGNLKTAFKVATLPVRYFPIVAGLGVAAYTLTGGLTALAAKGSFLLGAWGNLSGAFNTFAGGFSELKDVVSEANLNISTSPGP